MSRPWKRANGEEQKRIREREILDAALELNDSCPFSLMTLADIARSASFTRSNLYKYFPCREDLFLALLSEEYLEWVGAAETSFAGRSHNPKEFSHIWIDLILQYPRLLELFSLSAPLLEKGAGEESLAKWYESLGKGMKRLNATVLSLFPSADPEDINEFLNVQMAQIIGMVPLLSLDEKQRKLRTDNGLTASRNYFREILCHGVESLLSPWV